jgi:hypothetical protein
MFGSDADIPPVSWYGGSSRGNAFRDVVARPVGADGAKIPELVYVLYQVRVRSRDLCYKNISFLVL